MNWPPLLLTLRTPGPRQRFGCWIPFVLVWLPALALGIALSPLALVASALLWPAGHGRTLLLAGPALYRLFSSLRGLRVDVQGPRGSVYISFR